ncbi:MAG: Gfo/Idh/MocA family oxidoreductase [Acidobacteriota bacterium]
MSSAGQPRAAIVGAGLMGGWHAYFAVRAGVRIAAAVDSSPEKSRLLARRYRGARAFETLQECLQQAPLETVHVCTPTPTHHALAQEALQAGKHVLVEKPACATADQTKHLVKLAEEKGVQLVPTHQFPFQRGFRRFQERIEELGTPVRTEFEICTAGASQAEGQGRRAALLEMLPHPLAVFAFMFGPAVLDAAWEVALFSDDELELQALHKGHRLRIAFSLRGRPLRNHLLYTASAGTGYVDFFHGFSLTGRDGSTRLDKVLRPLRLSRGLLAASGFNLLRLAWGRQWAYPGLGELTALFYAAVLGKGESPLSPQETLGIAGILDRVRRAEGKTASKRGCGG